jgi:hypothetical protein
MHSIAGLDTEGLTRTGRWADPASAARYMHTEQSKEARMSDLLPAAPIRVGLVENKTGTE